VFPEQTFVILFQSKLESYQIDVRIDFTRCVLAARFVQFKTGPEQHLKNMVLHFAHHAEDRSGQTSTVLLIS
jgi:hypothetical protein